MTDTTEKQRFGWKKFLRALAAIAIPVALQNLLTTTGSMIDTMMIAPLGEHTVGAVGLCAQFSTLMFSGYWGFIGGGMLFYAQYWGAKDDDGIKRAYGLTTVCLLLVSLTFGALAVFAPEFVMGVYTDKPAIQRIGIEYLRIVGFAYPFSVLSVGMSALLRSTEKVRIPLFGALASVAANISLNYILIYGKLGIRPMGVRGAALATVCASIVNFSVVLILAAGVKYPYLFALKGWLKQTREWLGEYFRKCSPIICNELLVGVGNMLINVVLGRQSEQAIAATAVFRTLEGMVIGFFAGFSSAASVLVGTCVGAGELDRAYERAKRLVYLCGGCIFTVCCIIFSLHSPILHVMGLKDEAYSYGTGMLLIYCIAACIRMCNWVQNDTYRAGGDSTTATVIELVFMYILVLPCVFLSGLVFKLPYLVIFICCYIDEPVRFVLMQYHLYSGKWVRPVTPQGKAALAEFYAKHKSKGIVFGKNK